MTSDHELLQRYAQNQAELEFAELVHRYVDQVWGTARRITRDDHLARDVTQSVFIDLARKANRIPAHVPLAGWLHRAAFFAASKCVRANVRRLERERQTMELTPPDDPANAPDPGDQLLPLLDDGLDQLPDQDRIAVILRFFRKKSFADIGQTLGVSDDAAQKRVSRALAKLKTYIESQGKPLKATSMATLLTTAAGQLAPTGLAASIIPAAAAASVGTGTSLYLLNKLTITAMNLKTTLTIAAATAITVPLIIQHNALNQSRSELESLLQTNVALADLREAAMTQNHVLQQHDEMQQLESKLPELALLEAEAKRLGVEDLDEKRRLHAMLGSRREQLAQAQQRTERIQAEIAAEVLRDHTVNALKTIGMASRVWATDHDDTFPNRFIQMTNELAHHYTEGFGGNLHLENFEWVKHARPVSVNEPQYVLFREKQPRQLPNGTWERCYTHCDGSVITYRSDSPDFVAVEEKHHLVATDPTIPETLRHLPAYQKAIE